MTEFLEKALLALLSFGLTAVLGNALVQRWQARNWIAQQRFLGLEKEYVALKELIEEVGRLLAMRIYHMQRLGFALQSSIEELIKSRAVEHDEVVKQWNERLASFYVRLPVLVDHTLATRLEQDFQEPFASLSTELDRIRREPELTIRRARLKAVMDALNRLQGRSIQLNKELVAFVNDRRVCIYFGARLPYARHNLEKFSNSELIKALFVANVNAHSVLRSPVDS